MKLVMLGFGLGIVGEGTASVHYLGIASHPRPQPSDHLVGSVTISLDLTR
jgi:hypothetical protein